MDFSDSSDEDIINEVEDSGEFDFDDSSSVEESLEEDLDTDDYDFLDPMEVKQNDNYPVVKKVLPPGQRRSNKDFLDQTETAQLIATFTQMISNFNYVPPINTEGHDDPRDIAIKAIMERGLDRKKKTIPLTIERALPPVIDRTRGKIIQYVEHIDPNDPAIAIPHLPALKELSTAL